MEITQIKTDNLFHHPDNPRTDYKDIEELTASIKENGILQPLTVVQLNENIDRYNVVAGNRRLEAAKAAGLKECPCIIQNMSDKDQATLMLIENMQRKNLTPYEEGKGVQMCLDLGMNEKEIAEKTGFSKETIRHRKKLSELDQDKLKKKCADGQISMQDLIKLERITDPIERNEVLENIGTADFDWAYSSAIRHQERQAELAQIRAKLETFASEAPEDWSATDYARALWSVPVDYEIPEDADTEEYVFVKTNPGASCERYQLYRKISGEASDDDDDEDQTSGKSEWEKRQERGDKLREENRIFKDMRQQYVKDHPGMEADDLLQWIAYFAISQELDNLDEEKLEKIAFSMPFIKESGEIWFMAAMDFKELYEGDQFEIPELDGKKLHKAMTLMIYAQLEDNAPPAMHASYDYSYKPDDPGSELLYGFMDQLGYVPSEAEDKMMDGTHELYKED